MCVHVSAWPPLHHFPNMFIRKINHMRPRALQVRVTGAHPASSELRHRQALIPTSFKREGFHRQLGSFIASRNPILSRHPYNLKKSLCTRKFPLIVPGPPVLGGRRIIDKVVQGGSNHSLHQGHPTGQVHPVDIKRGRQSKLNTNAGGVAKAISGSDLPISHGLLRFGLVLHAKPHYLQYKNTFMYSSSPTTST